MFAEGRGKRFKKKKEGKKEIAAGVKGADGKRFSPTLDSSPACARMAALPGTVPRMMRPAPGQNYPRTGFPLEGKSVWTCLASLLRQDLEVLGEVAIFTGWWRRQRQQGSPLPFWIQVRAPDPGSFWDRHLSVYAWVSPTGGLSFTGPGLWPLPAGLNSE